MTRPAAWTDAENTAIIALYFAMLTAATSGDPYNKAAMIRATQQADPIHGNPHLYNRSRGSIEFKLCNATAAHAKLAPSAVTMDGFGYRALSNYQQATEDAMHRTLERRARGADGPPMALSA